MGALVAKAKKRRRKSSLINRGINAALLFLAFKPAIDIALSGRRDAVDILTTGYTLGLSKGAFNQNLIGPWYGPVIASFVLFEIKKRLMRKFRF